MEDPTFKIVDVAPVKVELEAVVEDPAFAREKARHQAVLDHQKRLEINPLFFSCLFLNLKGRHRPIYIYRVYWA